MDLKFLSGEYLYKDFPLGKEYLRHYFRGESERSFLSYYFTFPDLYQKGSFKIFYENFCDHTGCSYSTRWIRKLLVRLNSLESALEKASKNLDLTRVGQIKSGNAEF